MKSGTWTAACERAQEELLRHLQVTTLNDSTVTGRQLADWNDITMIEVRSIVHRLRAEFGEPICSSRAGYFMARTPDQMQGTLNHLRSRATSIWAAYRGLEVAANKMSNGELSLADPRMDLDKQTKIAFTNQRRES